MGSSLSIDLLFAEDGMNLSFLKNIHSLNEVNNCRYKAKLVNVRKKGEEVGYIKSLKERLKLDQLSDRDYIFRSL